MSKEAAMRAMREARFAERAAGRVSTPAKPAVRTAPAPAKPVKPVKPVKLERATTAAPPPDGLCGHRSMNGRTCTREQGHSAKSHRYS